MSDEKTTPATEQEPTTEDENTSEGESKDIMEPPAEDLKVSVDDAERDLPAIESMNDLINAPERLKILEPGDMLQGRILSVGKNEVYVDVDGIGLGVVRGRELYDDEQVLSALESGDKVYASVVMVENKDGNIELSFRKAGQERVWQSLREKKDSKEVITTKILEANKGGLMIKLNGVIGFLPVSQLAPSHYPRVEDGDKNKILAILQGYVGEDFEVQVITAEQDGEKLIVSERAAIEGQLMNKLSQFNVGDVVEGEITGVVDFGAFVKFGEELEGLIHISELAWQRIDDPKDIVKVGDRVKAQIISIDKDRVSLSMKRLQKDPWESAVKKYKVGQTVKGKVIKLAPYGAFVELDDDIHGLAHLGELSDSEIEDPSQILKIDDEKEFRIISIEPAEHRLGLSLKTPGTRSSKPAEEKAVEEESATAPAEGDAKTEEETPVPEAPVAEGADSEAEETTTEK